MLRIKKSKKECAEFIHYAKIQSTKYPVINPRFGILLCYWELLQGHRVIARQKLQKHADKCLLTKRVVYYNWSKLLLRHWFNVAGKGSSMTPRRNVADGALTRLGAGGGGGGGEDDRVSGSRGRRYDGSDS